MFYNVSQCLETTWMLDSLLNKNSTAVHATCHKGDLTYIAGPGFPVGFRISDQLLKIQLFDIPTGLHD